VNNNGKKCCFFSLHDQRRILTDAIEAKEQTKLADCLTLLPQRFRFVRSTDEKGVKGFRQFGKHSTEHRKKITMISVVFQENLIDHGYVAWHRTRNLN